MRKSISILIIIFCLVLPGKIYGITLIETQIRNAYVQAIRTKSFRPLQVLYGKIYSNKKMPNRNYWLAYTRLNEATYLKVYHKNNKNFLQQGISILQKADGNSENLALEALLQAMTLSNLQGMEAGIAYKLCFNNATRAISKNKNNVRAWYVMGTIDYYTPLMMGGQKKCEYDLKKAISLRQNKNANPWLPRWGKLEAYQLLITYYLSKGKKAEARKTCMQGLRVFPHSKELQVLGKKSGI